MNHTDWPIAIEWLWPFLAAVSLVELTPGPNMTYLALLAVSEGRGAALRAVAGVTLGLAIYLVAAIAGLAGLVASAPALYHSLRVAGSLYLLYLAWETWRGGDETSPGDARALVQDPFARGLIANLLNPKAAVFYAALLPGFTQPEHGPFWRQALILGVAHLMISILVHGAIVFGAARIATLSEARLPARQLRRVFAILIALVAAWLFWDTAQT